MREKLIELLGADTCKHDCCEDCEYCANREACIEYLKTSMADHLIANGVTIPVRCKDCKHFDPKKALRPGGIWCGYWGTDPDPEDWCCKGERRTDG